MVMKVYGLLKLRWVLGGALILAGVFHLALPLTFVSRAYVLAATPTNDIYLVYALGIALVGAGFAVCVEPEETPRAGQLGLLAAVALMTILYFLVLTLHLQNWWIDDAGITFAYSRSLAEGSGIVAQPWLPPIATSSAAKLVPSMDA